MTAVVGIKCDGCGATFARETVQQASMGPLRKAAAVAGWHRGRPGTYLAVNGHEYGYGRDICPTCWGIGTR